MIQSVPSRSNQDGISKSNTGLQLAGTVMHDKNTEERSKIQLIKKRVTSINQKYFSHFTQIEAKP